MRRLFLTFILGITLSGPVHAAAKKQTLPPPGPFDGVYAGRLTPAPALSKHACSGFAVQDFEIDRSRILAIPGIVSFEGTVGGDGFVSGAVHYADDAKAAFQGSITNDTDGTHVSAGVVDDNAGCAWTMDLKKQ